MLYEEGQVPSLWMAESLSIKLELFQLQGPLRKVRGWENWQNQNLGKGEENEQHKLLAWSPGINPGDDSHWPTQNCPSLLVHHSHFLPWPGKSHRWIALVINSIGLLPGVQRFVAPIELIFLFENPKKSDTPMWTYGQQFSCALPLPKPGFTVFSIWTLHWSYSVFYIFQTLWPSYWPLFLSPFSPSKAHPHFHPA